jgi:MFS family permease
VLAATGSAIMGFGMGLISICCLLLIQEAARPAERGSATAANIFARNLGSAFGATVFGVVVNLGLAGAALGGNRVTAQDLKRLLEAPGGNLNADPQLVATLAGALHAMFVAMFVVALVIAVVALFVPDDVFSGRRDAGKNAARPTDPSNAD